MILQALTNYYEALADKGKIMRQGWTKVKVSYAIEIDDDGQVVSVYSLKTEGVRGKKTVMLPRGIGLPASVKRSCNIAPNFLYDNAKYVFGYSKDDAERSAKCFLSMAEFHANLLSDIDIPAVKALLKYFENFIPGTMPDCTKDFNDDIASGANIVFMYKGHYLHDIPELKKVWQQHYDGTDDGEKMICLITGKPEKPMAVHPAIKGVKDTKSSGAAVITFNQKSFCSYNREQNLNAPVGKYASFAYTTALNYLLADHAHTGIIGDSTVVYWAENAEESYQDWYSSFIDGHSDVYTDSDLKEIMKKLAQGLPACVDEKEIKPSNRFFVLALSPNSSRISVRMFLCSTFGDMTANILKHYERLNIKGNDRIVPIWKLLGETVLKVSGKQPAPPSPQMSGDTLRAILTDTYYPATLYQQLQFRIRADRDINGIRASIIKAYLLKNTNSEIYKEVIQVELNETTTYQPYVLGRLFAVLELIQEKANSSINTTIKDKYFTSACSTPSAVFPILINLSEKHMRKLDSKNKIYCDKLRSNLMSLITESFSAHHTLYDQGIFQLGYYHQRQKRFEKKETNTIVNNKEEN